jgi:DNA-directed RNA polymerase subunit beta'
MKTTLPFTNRLVNKRELKQLIYNAFLNYGLVSSTSIVDHIKNLTFHYATKSGISISIEDLRIPYTKHELVGLTADEVQIALKKYNIGNITFIERFQKTIDIWNNANNFLKDEVLAYFRESDPLNPLYIMAFSGARGNISQVRQLMGMRGLMSDPQGQIIDLPIKSNFCEGLSVTEYIISSYGARKGLVDTALRTADSGYLTRRLVDVAQDIIVRKEDCQATDSLSESEIFRKKKYDPSRLVGRLLASDLLTKDDTKIATANTEITFSRLEEWKKLDYKLLEVRSPLTCQSIRSVCRNCYGWHFIIL